MTIKMELPPAPPPSLKRPADTDAEQQSAKASKQAKKEPRKQQCNVCWDHCTLGQFTKFKTCQKKECNRTCKFCWTKFLKTTAIQFPSLPIECFECGQALKEDQVIKFFNGNKTDIAHYEFRRGSFEALQNDERECSRSDCRHIQVHDQSQGRVFTCKGCSAEDCTICNVPEHHGETCSEYQTRLTAEHGHDEALSRAALSDGYEAEEANDKGEDVTKVKHPSPCPGCGILIERSGECHIIKCTKCGMHFCIRRGCGAVYLGPSSVPLLGNAAHADFCAHANRAKEDRRCVKQSSSSQPKKEKKTQNAGGDCASVEDGRSLNGSKTNTSKDPENEREMTSTESSKDKFQPGLDDGACVKEDSMEELKIKVEGAEMANELGNGDGWKREESIFEEPKETKVKMEPENSDGGQGINEK